MRPRLAVIGGGNMGYAIVEGAVEGDVIDADRVLLIDADPAKRDRVARLGCAVAEAPAAAVEGEELLVAVKPQDFRAVAAATGPLPRSTVVISVMAGLSSTVIRERLGDAARVIRAMPNTPCAVGDGMSAIAVGAGAAPADATLARELLGAIGATVDVSEELMEAVTAVSGSGPAYVFLVAEAMEAAALEVGLAPDTARVLVQQTIRGAANLMLHTREDPTRLRTAVTSKGGTTAAALAVFESADLRTTFREAIVAARDRGVELNAS